MSILEKAKTRGHWVIRVHPETHDPNRVQKLADLEAAVRNATVSLRGWDFPLNVPTEQPKRAADYVEQSLDWEDHVELWRAYKSGQFVAVNALSDDWRDQSELWPAPSGWRSGSTLRVEDAVFRLVEVFEFAARWVRVLGVQDSVTIECTLHGLQNRSLQLATRIGFVHPWMSKVPNWTHSETYQVIALLAQPRELATPPAVSLFELFGWDVTPDVIRDIQGKLRG